MKAITTPYPEIVRHEEEKYFSDPISKTKEPFPSLNESPTLSLSVIVPAYEEQDRCRPFRFPHHLNEMNHSLTFIHFSTENA